MTSPASSVSTWLGNIAAPRPANLLNDIATAYLQAHGLPPSDFT
jgi:hypothetical protein